MCNTLWWWCSKYCIYASSLNNPQMVQLQPHLQHTLMMLKVHAYASSLNITNGSIAKHFDDIQIMWICIVLGISQNSSDYNTPWWCSKYMNLCIFFGTSQMVQFATCFNDAQSYACKHHLPWPITNGLIITTHLQHTLMRLNVLSISLEHHKWVQLQHALIMLKGMHVCIFLKQSQMGQLQQHTCNTCWWHLRYALCIVLGISQNSFDCNTHWWCSSIFTYASSFGHHHKWLDPWPRQRRQASWACGGACICGLNCKTNFDA